MENKGNAKYSETSWSDKREEILQKDITEEKAEEVTEKIKNAEIVKKLNFANTYTVSREFHDKMCHSNAKLADYQKVEMAILAQTVKQVSLDIHVKNKDIDANTLAKEIKEFIESKGYEILGYNGEDVSDFYNC